MKISNKNIKLEMHQSLVDSIEFKGVEILNTTKNWTKKNPMLFPAIASGKKFNIGDNTYTIPRHGFWNDVNFNIDTSTSGLTMHGKVEHESYPFYLEIDQYIILNKNTISFTTTFTGQGIPMQFGHHPAFNYDLGGLKIKQDNVNVVKKGMTATKINVDVQNISELPWDQIDTFIFETQELLLENEKYNIRVNTNMKYIAVWTNGDKFICLEPWSNLPATVTPNDNITLDGIPLTMDITIEEKEN